MCRLCLPNTSLEQHFKYFTESGMKGKDIVDLVIKYHKAGTTVGIEWSSEDGDRTVAYEHTIFVDKDHIAIEVNKADFGWGKWGEDIIDAESRPVHKELPAPSSNPKKCPECGSFHLDTHIPSDGGPEPPKVICWDCGWWNEIPLGLQ